MPGPVRSTGAGPRRRGASALITGCLLVAVVLSGCGGASASATGSVAGQRRALVLYLRRVEPIRLAVNRLLEGADPILADYRSGSLSPLQASLAMSTLEQRFAGYTAEITATQSATTAFRPLHEAYAHTYVLETAYLRALAGGLAMRSFHDLPNTQAAQRKTIVQWRIGLTVLARHVALALPVDLQSAGRGEIAPSPFGS
jgi:hypothetical protein